MPPSAAISVAAADANARLPERAHRHQRHRFDDQLPDDARPARAERHAHTKLAHAARGARHHQVAKIRRRHDQDQAGEAADQRDDGEDGVPLARPHEVVAGEQRLQPLIALDLRTFGGHRLHRRAQRLSRRGAGDTPARSRPYMSTPLPSPSQARSSALSG